MVFPQLLLSHGARLRSDPVRAVSGRAPSDQPHGTVNDQVGIRNSTALFRQPSIYR
jgi:hypothetical protein